MVSNVDILIETASFSVLVSFFTIGISAASLEGAVLYPFRVWMDRLAKKQVDQVDKLVKYQQQRRGRRQASYWIDDAIKLAKIRLLRRRWWMKLLLLCSQCMPTLWGAIIYWTIFNSSPIYVWLLGWPISSAINYIINKKVL